MSTDDDDRTLIRPAAHSGPPLPAAAAPTIDYRNALPEGTRLAEFELTRVLGEGGFGIVYLAMDLSLGRRVALKEYMPSALAARTGGSQVVVKSERHRETFTAGLRSFVNEARLLAQFDHPALVKVYRFWEANGTAYMVMPFYQGITLKDKLRESAGPPDESWLMGILGPLTEALNVIHAESCFHRDIAPDNVILLEGSGRPLLLDFGAARRVIGDMTQALTVILKPGYAPVEQYAEVDSMKQGPWTDVYALAACVYFAIAGKTPPTAVGRMLSDTYVPLAELAARRYSDPFLRAIDRALRVKPEDRTRTINDLRAELGLAVHVAEGLETLPASFFDSTLIGEPNAPRPGDAASRRAANNGAGATGKGRGRIWFGVGASALAVAGLAAFLALRPGAGPPTGSTVIRPAPDASTRGQDAALPGRVAVPAPVPPAAVTPAAARPLSVPDEFDRIVGAQTAGFSVEASARRTLLRIDKDKLAFTVTSSRAGFVYVLWNDPDGSLYRMFPNGKSSQNRIAAGQTLALPQPSWAIVAAEPIGIAQVIVIVSEHERDFSGFGHTVVSAYGFLKIDTGDSTLTVARAHAGNGSALAGKADCVGANCDVYGAARFTVEVVR